MKTIAFASDHAGYQLKKELEKYVTTLGYQFKDFGTDSEESCDYPDFAHPAARAVESGECDFGICMCGSGNGMQMAHNNANILVLPARFITVEEAKAIVDAYLNTPFEGGRHQRRIDKIPVKCTCDE